MDPFRFCLAILPLAVYLLVLGGLQLGRRPLMIGGGRDLAAMAIALSGLMVVGPIELFLPRDAARAMGVYVWPLLGAFYVLCVTLAILTARPRLTIYNISLVELRPILGEVAYALDSEARWAGASLSLPRLGVELHADEFVPMRNVSLVAVHDHQHLEGWKRFEHALRVRLAGATVAPNPRGVLLVSAGLMLFVASYVGVALDPAATAQALDDMLRP